MAYLLFGSVLGLFLCLGVHVTSLGRLDACLRDNVPEGPEASVAGLWILSTAEADASVAISPQEAAAPRGREAGSPPGMPRVRAEEGGMADVMLASWLFLLAAFFLSVRVRAILTAVEPEDERECPPPQAH